MSSLRTMRIARPYAKALFDSSKTKGPLEKTRNDMNIVSLFLAKSSDLKKLLANPLITKGTKRGLVKALFGERISGNTLKFLLLLIDHSRIDVFGNIAQKFLELSYKHDSIEVAKITSSICLSPYQKKKIVEKLKIITGAKEIKLAVRVDRELITGFIIEIGSKRIDRSLRGQLRQVSARLGVEELFWYEVKNIFKSF
jgi:F-type H+-transporting ATPase subunit delta